VPFFKLKLLPPTRFRRCAPMDQACPFPNPVRGRRTRAPWRSTPTLCVAGFSPGGSQGFCLIRPAGLVLADQPALSLFDCQWQLAPASQNLPRARLVAAARRAAGGVFCCFASMGWVWSYVANRRLRSERWGDEESGCMTARCGEAPGVPPSRICWWPCMKVRPVLARLNWGTWGAGRGLILLGTGLCQASLKKH